MPESETAAAQNPAATGGDAILGAALEGLRRAAEEVEVERSTAETLQRSVLRETLPEVAGLRLAARYLPGSAEARIGGDWYDVIQLRDGKVALVIGDVVGRGIAAAARMAHLQSAVRAYALEGLRPSMVLDRMNGFAQELEGRGTATLLFAVIDADGETMRMASAGHPPRSRKARRAIPLAPLPFRPTRKASSRCRRARPCSCTPTASSRFPASRSTPAWM
jgi:hypothetical protein